MAVIQSTKSAAEIRIEARSPGVASASITIQTKQVRLRPQVAVWKREIPLGGGITGLWRPAPQELKSKLVDMLGASSILNSIFSFREEDGRLSGTVEGGGGFSASDNAPVPITDGVVDGKTIAFKSGQDSFEGKVNGSQIELQRFVLSPLPVPAPPSEDPDRPAIGPEPVGSDISTSRSVPLSVLVTLRRAER